MTKSLITIFFERLGYHEKKNFIEAYHTERVGGQLIIRLSWPCSCTDQTVSNSVMCNPRRAVQQFT